MSKNLTIVDIAKSAGVSKTTVSRYLNGRYEYMSEQTRERIKKVIEVSGYQPNKLAQSLKNQKSMLVGFVVADIESPFTSAAIKSVGDAMLGTGYNLVTANSDNSYERELENIQSLIGQQVDGLIVNTVTSSNPRLIGLANGGLPVVLLDRFVKDYNFDIAYFENTKSIHDAIEHLHEEGYRHLAYFTQEYEFVSPRSLRRKAFLEKLAEMGVEHPEQYAFSAENKTEKIEANLRRLLDICKGEPPAVICSNSVTLMRTVKAIRNLGLRMPHEIGLCGFDEWGWASELDWASIVDVGLTTILPSVHELGAQTVNLLFRRIQQPESEKKEIAIPGKLIVRDSTRLSKKGAL